MIEIKNIKNDREVRIADNDSKFSIIYIRKHPRYSNNPATILSIVHSKKSDNTSIEYYNGENQHRTGKESSGICLRMMKDIFYDVLEYINEYRPNSISINLRHELRDVRHKNKKAKEQIFTKIADRLTKKTGHEYTKTRLGCTSKKYKLVYEITYKDMAPL